MPITARTQPSTLNRARNPRPPPMSFSIQNADTTQLRELLNWLILNFPEGDYRIDCTSEREATSVRNRLNRIRAAEHDDMVKIFRENGQPVDERGALTEFDRMVFRIKDRAVLISISKRDMRALLEEFIATNGEPPCGAEAALASVPRAPTATPESDRFAHAEAMPSPEKTLEQRDAAMRDAQLI